MTSFSQGKLHQWPKDKQDYAGNSSTPREVPHIYHTDIKKEQNSAFQGHCVAVDSKDMIIPAISKLCRDHNVARATHNIYAYRIENASGGIWENCEDDGEFGAGRRLLNMLWENDVTNKMVIVTRWYGGVHMGPRRFQCILEAGRQAVHPHIQPKDQPNQHKTPFAQDFPKLRHDSKSTAATRVPPIAQLRKPASQQYSQQQQQRQEQHGPWSPPPLQPHKWNQYAAHLTHPVYSPHVPPPPIPFPRYPFSSSTSAATQNNSLPWQPWATRRF